MGKRWGEKVIERLSIDLKEQLPLVEGLSVTNLRYCRRFYLLYSKVSEICPQLEGEKVHDAPNLIHPQLGGEITDTNYTQLPKMIFNVPWGHHKLILDKVKGDINKVKVKVKVEK